MPPFLPTINVLFVTMSIGVLPLVVVFSVNRTGYFRCIAEKAGIATPLWVGFLLFGLVGSFAPAVLGWAPFHIWDARGIWDVRGWLYHPFFLLFVLTGPIALGTGSLLLRLRRATWSSLDSPLQPGLAVVHGTCRALGRESDEASHDDTTLVRDYRSFGFQWGGTAADQVEATGRLEEAVEFEVEGLEESVIVDPRDAALGFFGRRASEYRITDGDDVTVLGTLRVDEDGTWSMTGESDLLYVSNESPESLKGTLWRNASVFGIASLLCAGIAFWILWSIVG